MALFCITIFLISLLGLGTCDMPGPAELQSLDTKHVENGDRVFFGRIRSVKTDWESECWESPFYQVTYIAHAWNCKAFLTCYKGKAVRHECPADSAFNPDTSLCVPEELLSYWAPCRQSPAEHCKGLPSGYYLEDREDCKAYYICSDDEALHFFCPVPLVFDNYRSRCVQPYELYPGQPCSTGYWTTNNPWPNTTWTTPPSTVTDSTTTITYEMTTTPTTMNPTTTDPVTTTPTLRTITHTGLP